MPAAPDPPPDSMSTDHDRSLRLCFVSADYPTLSQNGSGGIGAHSYTLAHAVAALGHDVSVLAEATNVPGLQDDGRVRVACDRARPTPSVEARTLGPGAVAALVVRRSARAPQHPRGTPARPRDLSGRLRRGFSLRSRTVHPVCRPLRRAGQCRAALGWSACARNARANRSLARAHTRRASAAAALRKQRVRRPHLARVVARPIPLSYRAQSAQSRSFPSGGARIVRDRAKGCCLSGNCSR